MATPGAASRPLWRASSRPTSTPSRSLAGRFKPTAELDRLARRADELNREIIERAQAAGLPRDDVHPDDLTFVFEQVASLHGPTPERTAQLRASYLTLQLDGLRTGAHSAPRTVADGRGAARPLAVSVHYASRVRTAAILPVKSFSRAKQRLGDALGSGDRERLAAAMVADMLSALSAVEAIDDVVMVTAEPLAVRAARRAGAVVVDDPDEAGQSAAAVRGIVAALERGADRALLVPGDCPAADPRELAQLVGGGAGPPSVVIVPDRHGAGTNALLLSPPGVVAPWFGSGSFARHAARSRGAGATVQVFELPSLALDVDTPDDLAALRAALERRPAGAPRTREALDRLVHATV